jgi:hypothetical protein
LGLTFFFDFSGKATYDDIAENANAADDSAEGAENAEKSKTGKLKT